MLLAVLLAPFLAVVVGACRPVEKPVGLLCPHIAGAGDDFLPDAEELHLLRVGHFDIGLQFHVVTLVIAGHVHLDGVAALILNLQDDLAASL